MTPTSMTDFAADREPAGPGARKPIALTLAGSDPSGGAGLQADLKVFQQHGVFGMAVPTLLTIQNSRGVREVISLEPHVVARQLDALLEDFPIDVCKLGALGTAEVVRLVAAHARQHRLPLIVDPVISATVGGELLEREGVLALLEELLPVTTLLTPNLDEASRLAGFAVQSVPTMIEAGESLLGRGAHAVLVKGGHLRHEPIDVLVTRMGYRELNGPRIGVGGVHGTGCAYASAIAARLARAGGDRRAPSCDLLYRVALGAKAWLTNALRNASALGSGAPLLDFLQPVAGEVGDE